MYDEDFKARHRLTFNILKEFGYGKSIMERRITQELRHVVENIKKVGGGAFYPEEIVTAGFVNVMASILYNKTYRSEEPELSRLIELMKVFFSEYYDFMAADSFEWLMILPYYKKKLRENIVHRAELMDLVQKSMLFALANKSQGESFVSSYLDKEGDTDYDYQQFVFVLRDLLLGGVETTSSSLQWFIVFMANHQDKQDKVQEEIDAVVGEREITLEDEKNLPYIQAAMLELTRRVTVGPLALPHCAVEDTTIRDFFVPADSHVSLNHCLTAFGALFNECWLSV